MRELRRVVSAAGLLCVVGWVSPAWGQSVERLWETSCVKCHGERGQGGGAGTRSLLEGEYQFGGSDAELFKSIKDGHPDAGMEAFAATLSDPQIWGLVVHIRELQDRDRRRRERGPRAVDGVYTTAHARFTIETVVERGLSVPWSVDWLPDGAMLIANRPGQLKVFAEGALSEPVAGTPAVRNRGQGGLMEVAVHPRHAENGWIYLSFSDERREGNRSLGMTKIVRGKLVTDRGGGWRWTDQETVWESEPRWYLPTDLHFGCKIAFGPDGKLYFTLGERGRAEHAQDVARPNGKVHRINDDGSIPADNPFAGREGAQRSIWSYGHRNPQGLTFDLEGRLWDTEHGPRGGDELNLVAKGANYGWPVVSYGINYNGAPLVTPWPKAGQEFTMPTVVWTPSIAASGLDVVGPGPKGEAFPGWKGDLLAGGLAGETVRRLRVRAGSGGAVEVVEQEEIVYNRGRVRDVRVGPDGAVYLVLNGPDEVVRLTPAK